MPHTEDIGTAASVAISATQSFYSYNQERFMQNYHKRSNVESTFHMIKAKFGDDLRSKTKTAQINEALCKILCHNLCCLIQSMYELNLKPKFWNDKLKKKRKRKTKLNSEYSDGDDDEMFGGCGIDESLLSFNEQMFTMNSGT